jgi:hypothetical protein
MTDWLWAALLLTGFATWVVVPVLVVARLVQRRVERRAALERLTPPPDDDSEGAQTIDLRIWQDLRDLPRHSRAG